MIYETKGLTLEQVDELSEMMNAAWKSKDLRPQVSFREAAETGQRGMSMRQMSIAQERRVSKVGEKEEADTQSEG